MCQQSRYVLPTAMTVAQWSSFLRMFAEAKELSQNGLLMEIGPCQADEPSVGVVFVGTNEVLQSVSRMLKRIGGVSQHGPMHETDTIAGYILWQIQKN